LAKTEIKCYSGTLVFTTNFHEERAMEYIIVVAERAALSTTLPYYLASYAEVAILSHNLCTTNVVL
jgi:F0F1-type ATP synthase alpha subunit